MESKRSQRAKSYPNPGHEGLDEKWGGSKPRSSGDESSSASVDGEDRKVSVADLADRDSEVNKLGRENWDDLSDAERMSLMDPDAIDMSMQDELDRYRQPYSSQVKFQGKKLTSKGIEDIGKNADAYIESLDDALTPITREKLNKFVHDFYLPAVDASVSDGSLELTDKEMDVIMRGNIDKLVFQEIESRKRQMGDHGIRHVVGNIERSFQMIDELESVPSLDRLMVAQAMVDHDIGLTAGVATQSFTATNYHPQYSEKFVRAQDYPNRLFPGQEDRLYDMVLTHSDPDMDWEGEPARSALRVSDNTALFQEDKLRTLFVEIPGATTELYRLQLAKQAGMEQDYLPETKRRLKELVGESDFDPRIKAELVSAADEVFFLTPKFNLGMLAGEVSEFDYDPEAVRMDIYLTSTPEREPLNGIFDMGERQFEKFMKSYDSEGSPDEGLLLRERNSGDAVLSFTYNESEAGTSQELSNLNAMSIRPVLSAMERQLGPSPTPERRQAVWDEFSPEVSRRLTDSEIGAMKALYGEGVNLTGFPLTKRERTFMQLESLKSLKILVNLMEGNPGHADNLLRSYFGRSTIRGM